MRKPSSFERFVENPNVAAVLGVLLLVAIIVWLFPEGV